MMKYKFISLMVVAAFAMGLTACNSGSNRTADAANDAAEIANSTATENAATADEQAVSEVAAPTETAAKRMAPDFTLNDLEGQPLSLSMLRGKVVVIDFWGSWCKWCIKGFPEMKKYYEKYRDRMEILGVDCGDSPETWRQAVHVLGLPWRHVYCPQGHELTDLYAIEGFPTKVVVGPEGTVENVFVGEDPAFYDFLDTVLSK